MTNKTSNLVTTFAYAHVAKQMQGTATGRKFYLDGSTALDIQGHGDAYLIGSEDGTLNAESGCWVS